MMQRKKRNIIIGALCAVVLLMTVGYAAFQTVLNISGTSNITSNWNIKITNVVSKNVVGSASNNGEPTFEDLSATFKTNLISPGDSMEYELTVTNSGNMSAKLDKYKLTDANNPVIKFTQTGLTQGEVLAANSTKTFVVKVEYLDSVTSQPNNINSNLSITLDYSQVGNEYVPGDITASEMLTSNIVTSGDGLYTDTYEAGRYIYRGTNPNNYITFNNEVWRVISVESDGTLKIIREEKLETTSALDYISNRASTDYCRWASSSGCNVWGSKTTMLDSLGKNVTKLPVNIGTEALELPDKEASLNVYLNTDYYNSIEENSKKHISIHMFNVGLVRWANESLEDDINQEKTSKWKGNIGLANPSDYFKVSIDIGCIGIVSSVSEVCKNQNYLYKARTWWTMTPNANLTSGATWGVYKGVAGVASIYDQPAVFPVLFLNSNITISGSGTSSSPYMIN